MSITFVCRDNESFSIPLEDFTNMDDFFLRNLVLDTSINDQNQNNQNISINDDMLVVKSIVDSIRLKTLIYDNRINLRYMKALCDKWCVPYWLLDMINDELCEGKVFVLLKFINAFFGETRVCKVCGCGFKVNDNGPKSCRRHLYTTTISGSNNYSCCNKEEPCQIGYHASDLGINTATSLIHIINNVNGLL